MSLDGVKQFAMVTCVIYSLIMLKYTASICGFRNKYTSMIGYPIVIISASLYTRFTLHEVPIPYIYTLAFLIIVVLFHALLKGTWIQHIFATGNYIFHIICARGISLVVMSIMYDQNLYTTVSDVYLNELSLAISFFILIHYLVLFIYKLYPVEKIRILAEDTMVLKMMLRIQLTVNIFFILGSILVYNESIPKWFSFYQLLLIVVILAAFYILFHYSIKSCNLKKVHLACHIYEEQLKNQVSAYNVQVDYIYKIREFKRDFVRMYHKATPILEKKEDQALLNFFHDLNVFLQKTEFKYKEFSSNPQIQALLYDVDGKCKEKGIKFNATAVFPSELPIKDFELCCIFNDVLNDALNACEKIEGDEKYIHISTAMNARWCTIVCENSFNGVVQEKNKRNIITNTLRKEVSDHWKEDLESCGGFIKKMEDVEEKKCKVMVHIPITHR